MMVGEKKKQASMQEREAMFYELLSGKSFDQVAFKYNCTVAMLKYWLSHCEICRHWRADVKTRPKRMKEEILRLLSLDCDLLSMADLINIDYQSLLSRIKEIEREDHRYYLRASAIERSKRDITVYDVARFKQMVNVGEMLVCDETDDGIQLWCKVLKKHKWYADTDQGGIEWNWLCVKNKRRLDGEIIHG